MKIRFYYKYYFFSHIKIEIILISFVLYSFLFYPVNKNFNGKKNIKIALCTMGKRENLYVKEFIEYYIKLGIDQIFIYDDNDPKIEKIQQSIDKKYQNNVTVYEIRNSHIKNQSIAFSECYANNSNRFDWFLMVDMDEYLYIVNDSLKEYLTSKRFNKCDFIKFHWVLPTDNDLIYYDPRPLFERFRPPYIKSEYIKSIIRGNIPNLKYWVHSPFISPKRNITCNNFGRRIYYKNMNFETISPKNTKKAYIIHFKYKSTEELINKFKRGYNDWFKDDLQKYLNSIIKEYLTINKATPEKVKFIEKELNLNLSNMIKDINKKQKYKPIFKKFFGIFH